jgi:hypothetical protein
MKKMKSTRRATRFAGRLGAITGGGVVALGMWLGLGGSTRAASLAPDPVTCLPTCAIDGRSLVVAGDDDTTLGAQEITIGLNFTVAAGPDGNFELFDGDRVAANWDVPFNDGTPAADPSAPELILELFADPAGVGGSGPAILTWTPGAVPSGTELGSFPVTNNAWNGVTFTHDAAALNGSNYQYALHIKPANPTVDKGWNAFKIRAAGTVLLLGNQVLGFLGAMNVGDGTMGNPGDLTTIYPAYPSLTPTVYDGTWSFKTRLPAFLGDVTIFDGDMDFGDARCTYNDTDDPDSSGIPPFANSAAVPEGVAQATGQFAACSSPGVGIRTGLPADDQGTPGSPSAFRRVPSIVPAGIAYQLVAPPSPSYPGGQLFLNQNPSGNKEWEQFKIELVAPGDAPLGPCPAGGYPADAGKGYEASDCRTDELPGGVWEIQLDGMDLSNLNFWFFGFKVEPIVTEYSIGRLVWYDANANGVQDLCSGVPCAPELGIANVAYTVYDGPLPGGTVVRAGVTDANGEFLESALPAGNYTVVVDAGNFAVGQPLNGLSSTTGGETENGIEVGLPICIDTNNPVGCGQPQYAEAIFGYVMREPEKVGVTAPTNTTCQDYASGTIQEENTMFYTLNGNNIANVTPGMIYYYTTVTIGAGEVLTVVQSHTGTGSGPLIIHQVNQARVYTTTCGYVTGWTGTQNTSTGTVSFPPLQPGTYIVQVKYVPKSLSGQPKPVPDTIYYTFAAALNGVVVPTTENDPALALVKK